MPDETVGQEPVAETVRITGHGGDEIEAYLARPVGPGPFPGVVVLHHMPGYDQATKEIARTFAANGYTAILPNLHWREAPGASPDDAAAAVRAAGGVPDERLAANLSCPLLGLFGAEDTHPSPAETTRLERELTRHGKTFEFHTFDGAGHGFFAVDRPSYRPHAAAEGWSRIFDWFGRYLS